MTTIQNVQKILWLKTDAIGDSLLALGLLRSLARRYPGAAFIAVCQESCAELYSTLPFVSATLVFNRNHLLSSRRERARFVFALRSHAVDLCCCPVYSRDELADLLALSCGARETVTYAGDAAAHHFPALRMRLLHYYTHLVDTGDESSEVLRHACFARYLGADEDVVTPALPLPESEKAFARRLFSDHGLDPARTLAFFPGARQSRRETSAYAAALRSFCREHGFAVVALGDAASREIIRKNLLGAEFRFVSIAGETSLLQAAAVIASCRLALGAESGLAHVAAAVGVDHIMVLGGGHFGRFAPYHAKTVAVSLPLECFGCNWSCPYGNYPCISAVAPETILFALSRAMEGVSSAPRLVLQGRSLYTEKDTGPQWSLSPLEGLHNTFFAEIVEHDKRVSVAPKTPDSSAVATQALPPPQRLQPNPGLLDLELFKAYNGITHTLSPWRHSGDLFRIHRLRGKSVYRSFLETASYAMLWLVSRSPGCGARSVL